DFFADFLAFFADFFDAFLADFFADFFFAATTFFFLAFLDFFFFPLAIVVLLLPPNNAYRASLSRPAYRARPTDQFDPGRGPPVAQSRSSIVCTTGTDVPPAICTMHPILPAAIRSGLTLAILATFRSPNLPEAPNIARGNHVRPDARNIGDLSIAQSARNGRAENVVRSRRTATQMA